MTRDPLAIRGKTGKHLAGGKIRNGNAKPNRNWGRVGIITCVSYMFQFPCCLIRSLFIFDSSVTGAPLNVRRRGCGGSFVPSSQRAAAASVGDCSPDAAAASELSDCAA